MLQNLEPGTWVLAEGPHGAMTAERRTRRDVLLIAGGVGITPMLTLFESLPLGPGQDLLLLYRARSEQDLIFQRELDQIAQQRGARVRYLIGPDIDLSPSALRSLVPGLRPPALRATISGEALTPSPAANRQRRSQPRSWRPAAPAGPARPGNPRPPCPAAPRRLLRASPRDR